MSDPLKVALYSHDSFGLGHLRRCLHLSWWLTHRVAEIQLSVLTGSPRARAFDIPPGTDVVKLPPVTKNKAGEYISRQWQVPLEETIRVRKRRLRRALLGNPPDLLIVDHVPFGLQGELLPLLADLRRSGCRLVLGLRDIIDSPERVKSAWHHEGVEDSIQELYDEVWVYGDPQVFDVCKEYELSPAVVSRLRYLGYLGRPMPTLTRPQLSAAFPDQSRPHILCTVGGGEDGLELMDGFVELARRETWFNGTLVTGPFMGQKAREIAERGVPSNIHILRFTTDMERLLAGSDLIVSMAGYNTVVEALSLRSRMLVVPRVFPREEQLCRAQSMGAKDLLRSIDPRDLDPSVLAQAMRVALEDPRPPHPQEIGISWSGGEQAAQAVIERYHGTPSFPPSSARA